jgi:hypothetical protein
VIGSDYSRHPIPGQQALHINHADCHNFTLPEEPTVPHYTFHENAEAPAFMSLRPGVSLHEAVESVTGRVPGPWLSKNLHRKGVCYCAPARGTRGGIVVRRQNAS